MATVVLTLTDVVGDKTDKVNIKLEADPPFTDERRSAAHAMSVSFLHWLTRKLEGQEEIELLPAEVPA